MINQPQLKLSDLERQRYRRLNMAPVKHQPSDDFNLDPKTVKQARASSPKPSVKSHMSPKGGGSGQGWEREADLSQCPGVMTWKLPLICQRMRAREDKRGASGVAMSQMIHTHLLQ